MAPARIDERIKDFATARQAECIDAVNEHGSIRAAARVLGVNYNAIRSAVEAAKTKAAAGGFAPGFAGMDGLLTPAESLKGRSLYHDVATGKTTKVWIKTDVTAAKREAMFRQMVGALVEDARGLAPMVEPPSASNDDLVCVYPWGDPHIGMYAWAAEAGDDFDLEIAERLTFGAVDRLVATAPPSGTGIILPLGDFFHANDQSNVTPGHKHQLDVDSRFGKVLGVGVKTLRRAILRALEKHSRVIVRIVRGNHDPEATWALRAAIAAHFENDPRVEVDNDPAEHWFYRFGRVLIGACHGDKTRHDKLLGVMAADRPEDWGATRHRYFYTGHIHSTNVTEYPGLVCESFRTLAAKDAYAAGHGYRAGRDMRLIVHHREHGEVERHRVDIGMLEAA